MLEAAPSGLSCLLDPLDCVPAAVINNVAVEAHELLPAALLVALEVVPAGTLVVVQRMCLADAVRDVGTLTQGHWEGPHAEARGSIAAVLLQGRKKSRHGTSEFGRDRRIDCRFTRLAGQYEAWSEPQA